MTPPTIRRARALAKELQADGIVLISVHQGQVAAASYGGTKRQCDALGQWLDDIMRDVNLSPLAEFDG